MPVLFGPVTGAPSGASQDATSNLILRLEAPGKGPQACLRPPSDLQYDVIVPGGYGDLSCTVPWPSRDPTPPWLYALSTVQVIDRRNGEFVYHGYLRDPGRHVDRNGMTSWKVTAEGGQGILDGLAEPVCIIDQELDNWVQVGDWPAANFGTGDGGGFVDSALDLFTDAPDGYLEIGVPDGTVVKTGRTGSWSYRAFHYSATDPAKTAMVWVFLSTMSAFAQSAEIQFHVGATITGAQTQVDAVAVTATQIDMSGAQGIGAWTVTDARHARIRYNRTGAQLTTAADHWHRFAGVAVYGRRFTESGAALDVNSNGNPPPAFDIVRDAVGRMLIPTGLFATASMSGSTVQIDQACWWEGITAREMLDFATEADPDYWWWVLGPVGNTVNGPMTFESRAWDTGRVRYIIPPDAEADLDGGAEDLADEALVVYKRKDGATSSIIVSSTVDELDRAGIPSRIIVDITDRGPVNATVATSAGTKALTDAAQYRSTGQVTVTGPVVDRIRGRVVQPWEILPGWPVVLAGTDAVDWNLDATTFGTPDAQRVHRLTAVTVNVSATTATLSLNGGARSLLDSDDFDATPAAKGPKKKRKKRKKRRRRRK